MEKTKKEKAIKQLQMELKEEKQAEIARCVLPFYWPEWTANVYAYAQTEGDHIT